MSLIYTVQFIYTRHRYIFLALVGIVSGLPSYCLKNNTEIYATGNQEIALINHAPVFSSGSYSYIVKDNIAPGNAVGIASASDPDGDAVIYEIKSGNTNKIFSINSVTGLIVLEKVLNYHTQNQFTLTVRARDMAGLSTQAPVVIYVQQGLTEPAFDSISWGTAANQAYTVDELQGEVVNGKLYTFGGFDSQKPGFTPTSRAYMFDPAANTWTRIADMPTMNGTTHGGVTHAGFTTDGTDIYFAGGYTSNSTGTGQIFGTGEAWKYVVAENRYERLPNLPIPIAAGQLEYLAGKLHYISGTNLARTMDLEDHYVLNVDSLSKGWKKLAPLPNPRQHAGSVVYEGKIYFIGGQHGQDAKLVAQKDVHSYNPATDTWTKMADLPVPVGATGRGHISSAAIVLGKYIIVLAGETVHAKSRTNMVSAYTPQTNTWKNLTPLPQSRYSGVAANLSGIIYYTGGSSSKVTYKGTPSVQRVQSATLINADTDQPLQTLKNGDTLNLASFTTKNFNIRANSSPALVGSVVFNLTGAQVKTVTESIAPYAFYGDNMKGDYYNWTPAIGKYTLTCIPYSSSKGAGVQGAGISISFTVINNSKGTLSLLPFAANESKPADLLNVKIYPNPVRNTFSIEFYSRHSNKFTVQIIDVAGRVYELDKTEVRPGMNNLRLDISKLHLSAGIYFLAIKRDNNTTRISKLSIVK